MPHPKVGLLGKKHGCPPPNPPSANSHMFEIITIRATQFLYYLGVVYNFRRVLNCVATIFCEIEEMRKWPSDENWVFIKHLYIMGRKNKSCGTGLGVLLGYWGIKNYEKWRIPGPN